jgi:hypothetical protein
VDGVGFVAGGEVLDEAPGDGGGEKSFAGGYGLSPAVEVVHGDRGPVAPSVVGGVECGAEYPAIGGICEPDAPGGRRGVGAPGSNGPPGAGSEWKVMPSLVVVAMAGQSRVPQGTVSSTVSTLCRRTRDVTSASSPGEVPTPSRTPGE